MVIYLYLQSNCVVSVNEMKCRLYAFIVARCGGRPNIFRIQTNCQANFNHGSDYYRYPNRQYATDGGKCNAKSNHRNRKQAKEQAHTLLGIAKGSRNKILEPDLKLFSVITTC